MAISFWKCLERRGGRTRLKPRPQNTLRNTITPKNPKYQNTYRLTSYNPFRVESIDEVIKTLMENRLEDINYDATTAPQLCSQIASEIRKRIVKFNFDRYKIVVVLTMIEKSSQSIESKLGFLWDIERDNYSTYSIETQTFFAYCFIVGVYYE